MARTPLGLLRWAQAQVPAVRYASGAVGVAAAGAIILGLLGNFTTALMAAGFVLIAMFLLFVFSQLVGSSSSQPSAAGVVMMWFIVVVFILSVVLTISAAATGWPPQWARLIGIKATSAPADVPFLSTQVTVPDTASGRKALQQLIQLGLNAKDADVRSRVRDDLRSRLLATGDPGQDMDVRAYRRRIMAALLEVTNRDLTAAFGKEDMRGKEWVDMDLHGVRATGLNLTEAFLLNSNLDSADLSGANLSGAMLRGVDLHDARLAGTSWSEGADWFNTKDLQTAQLDDSALSTMESCPKPRRRQNAEAAFIARANDLYVVPFDRWRADESGAAEGFWRQYVEPGGLCARVAASKASKHP